MYGHRWEEAQRAEKKYWQGRGLWLDDLKRYEQYWHQMLAVGYGLDYLFFKGKRVLEIGCGPAGIIFSIHSAIYKIGIEPMDISEFINDPARKEFVKTGSGEHTGFEDKFFDIVVCFNVLDHTANPPVVLKEAHRVLHNDGEFLLWLHTLLPKYRFLRPLLNQFDSPHPHHLTSNEIIQLVTNTGFDIKYKKIFSGLGPVSKSSIILHDHNIKSKLGTRMMEDLWIRLKKKI
jgi:ubiquinone/menaquinone biosynthesis C-methylase UbiE